MPWRRWIAPGDGKVMIVFGATGERDQLKRPIMGAIAAQYADIVVVTDDDPHGEAPEPIVPPLRRARRRLRTAEPPRS